MARGLSPNELMDYARPGVEKRIAELEAEIARLRASLGSGRRRGRLAKAAEVPLPRRRRKMSAAGRAKIAAAAKARWAKWRKENKAGK